MKNIPERIYLQTGDECPNDCDFEELGEVTWNKGKIYENDIEYRRAHKGNVRFEKSDLELQKEINEELKKERDRLKVRCDVTLIGYIVMFILFMILIFIEQ